MTGRLGAMHAPYAVHKSTDLVADFGLGFSEVCKFMRPLLKALPRGTVLKLKSWCRARAVGLLSHLGNGSIYRFGESKTGPASTTPTA